ncbi:protein MICRORCHIDIA 7 isoform X2 [Andrographis paniculata]|uniref:protein MICRORCHIDIA 7 isoform X2 n=1 Tax=Andrographis paniculata TaxID=175694 RepID=UPI0021E7CB10|nr:protein MICRORCHIDIA 7 isoform X2 [Andrographis paniculata]
MPEKIVRRRQQVVSMTSSSSSGGAGAGGGSAFISSSDSDSDFDDATWPRKKLRVESILPAGFLDPISDRTVEINGAKIVNPAKNCSKEKVVKKERGVTTLALARNCRQFWKAGDYDADCGGAVATSAANDRFSDAFAELLDNALDEVCNGATYVSVDVLENDNNSHKMVVVQDNGGGMTPNKMRQCMSLGYSAKSKMANTIGQYGNGFKTSTMRLGADVIVFSRCRGMYGEKPTQSIGLLSYTFLQNTGKEDIVVPMIDYDRGERTWIKHEKSSAHSWQRNLEIIQQWSPFDNYKDLLRQFDFLEEQGTRIIIYNLWEDDEGSPELDFDTVEHDIQIRGASRDESQIENSELYPSSRHFFTYRHSLRSYAAILYREIPPGFRIVLRGIDIEHHDIIDDMIYPQEMHYKPAVHAASKDPNVSLCIRTFVVFFPISRLFLFDFLASTQMSATGVIGFIKDAKHHIDVQGFNVYHKNRLIKPFWRVWNPAGSDGRGVIGVLEANFVEPAHDKQGFERTTALSRLESRLMTNQKNYWSRNCHLIGYAQRRGPKNCASPEPEASTGGKNKSGRRKNKTTIISDDASAELSPEPGGASLPEPSPISSVKAQMASPRTGRMSFRFETQIVRRPRSIRIASPLKKTSRTETATVPIKINETASTDSKGGEPEAATIIPVTSEDLHKLRQENENLTISLRNALEDLQHQKDENNLLQTQLEEANRKVEQLDREEEMFVSSFAEERRRRDENEATIRKKLQEASETIEALLEKVKKMDAAAAANACRHNHCR